MRVITLTTDFGAASLYVAQLHASILSAIAAETNVAPRIVDITHAVPPQDIRQGAIAIGECCPLFPLGSIHVGVVDPGVGSDRAIVACRCDGHFYVAPDNGLLSRVASPRPADFAAVEVTDSRFWRAEVSSTFHGRDMMAPVAAHLARGVELAEFGPASASLQLLDLPSALSTSDEIRGQVE
ncbi:MAG: SAM-dependent chlorinase/fluorinase, partial [Pirellulaceae bacterium]|nr:SAM-dependent chlorinase/fluorinase [Pirellulaceae bacterium]